MNNKPREKIKIIKQYSQKKELVLEIFKHILFLLLDLWG